MNAAGNVVPNVSNSGAGKEMGGHIISAGFKKWLDELVIRPPFNSKHGYVVRVFYPPQSTPHGNTNGVPLDIFGSRFKDSHIRSENAVNPSIDSRDDFR